MTATRGNRGLVLLLGMVAVAAAALCVVPEFRFDRKVMHMAPAIAWMGPGAFLGSVWAGPAALYRGKATRVSTVWFMLAVTAGNVLMVASELGRDASGRVVAGLIPIVLTTVTVLAIREWYTGPLAGREQSPEAER